MELGIQLVVMLVLGIIAAAIASSKGRSVAGWFFGGFFLGLIGVIIVAVLSNKKNDQLLREHTEMEQRRLREQLRQEQLKNEAFRRYSMERLDNHDEVLGVDTRTRAALPGGQQAQPALLPGDPASALGQLSGVHAGGNGNGNGDGQRSQQNQWPYVGPDVNPAPAPEPAPASVYGVPGGGEPLWYYEFDGQTMGPTTEMNVKTMLTVRQIGPLTLLWKQGMADWTQARFVDEFKHLVTA